jgi:hypothetical protein
MDNARVTSAASDFLDLRHAATDRATIVVVPERRLLAIDGVGSPTGADFEVASEVLRRVARKLRARLKHERSIDTPLGLLESAWWAHPELPFDEMAETFADRSEWHWQQMIEIPPAATDSEAEAAIDEARREAAREQPLVRVIRFTEGRAAQILHHGGSESGADALRKLRDAVLTAGLRPRGHIHQLVVADPRRVPLDRARSILRLPVDEA